MSLPTGVWAEEQTRSTIGGTRVGGGLGSVGGSVTHAMVVTSAADDWPELHQTPLLGGYASNSPLSSTNASGLGVAWATDLYSSALDSPAIAYDSYLGATLAYIGTESGNVLAINLASGQIVWGVWLGSPIRSSPLVTNGSVFIGTDTNPALFKLNATTGATQCSVISPTPFEATPTVATPKNGVATVYIGANGEGSHSGPFLAVNEANCTIEWAFTGYNHTAGSWDSASYAVSKGGVPMVLFGTDDPDSSIYAINALTGQLIWRFQTYNPPGADLDVGAGVTISPPGKNGFAQGVAYATNKAGRAYALDLNNGSLIWETNFNALAGTTGDARSTPALDGMTLVFGYAGGLFALNASTGGQVWIYHDPSSTEAISSPAIAGGHGHAIVAVGDLAGELDVVAIVGGSQLYTYPTGGYITASPAISGGNIVIASSNGFLYDFVVGGGNHATLPSTSISSPAQGATLANPNGNLSVTGTAVDPTAVVGVNVAVQSGGPAGPWWDGASRTWSPGPIENPAALAHPGNPSTSWSLAFPVARAGGTFQVVAYAVSSSGQSDLNNTEAGFSVRYSTSGPHLVVSPSSAAPGSAIMVHGGGFGRSQKVNLSLPGVLLATITSAKNGSLPSTRILLPTTSLFGLTSLTAVGQKSGASSSAPLTIANSWQQLGYDPGHDGNQPYDLTLRHLVFPGDNNWVKMAWHFDAKVPINASPAVVDGVAYVGDSVGNLFAVDIHNGGLLWNFTLASAGGIDGSPAVDRGLGRVFVGSQDGSVDAVYLANGTLAWSTHVGGNVSAPVEAGGELYVTSGSGAVAALAESNGAVSWSKTLASPATSAPALNASVNLLVVGESNGKVVGLNSSTGGIRWTYSTGSAVTAPAVLLGDTVYVGSTNHKVYALNQATGTKRWSFTTGGAIRDTGSLSNGQTPKGALTFFIGSDDGTVYGLRASNGSLLFNVTVGAPVAGLSTQNGVVVFETSTGLMGAVRSYPTEGGWNFTTGGPLVTAPVLIDGTIYLASEDGNLYAFTPNGQPPI
ncbi:MAG: PQQ-binding-like beta-propeller repeat protein [Thermoplasmata archaeon]|nr:PQQ-binding-like beta-propeller repeat protein [Thermoplasmata archaeon]